MADFSEESKLLAENWDTVEHMLAGIERLRGELSAILLSLRPQLERLDWWDDDWLFREYKADQVCISRRQWQTGDEHVVWIGLEEFSVEAVFGDAEAPNLYVWVEGKRTALVEELIQHIESLEEPMVGEFDDKPSSGYVAYEYLQKCLPEEMSEYAGLVRKQALRFFEHWAIRTAKLDELIARHL